MSLSLKVLDAYARDLGNSIAILDSGSMQFLGVSENDMIDVKAGWSIALSCALRDVSDKNIGNAAQIIRIDKPQRSQLGIAVGDTVIVKKL